jgi:hypothetical protein
MPNLNADILLFTFEFEMLGNVVSNIGEHAYSCQRVIDILTVI